MQSASEVSQVGPLALSTSPQHTGASDGQQRTCLLTRQQVSPNSFAQQVGPLWLLPQNLCVRGHGGAARATPGMAASAPPRRAAPINRRALPRERVPLASSLASSSKARSLVSLAIVCRSSLNGAELASPAVLRN